MLTFLTAHHDTLGASTITRKVVDALWASCPDEAARTVTGVMMGFLPTTEGILRRVLVEWTQDGTLMALKAMAAAASMRDAGQAIDLIGRELRRTMMLRPVPEQIWRTATSAHELGADPLQRVQVRPGDKIILALVSATHAVLESATGQNVFPVFGGNREAVTPATHACPGYNAAMGVLTGVIAALLDVDAELRTGPPPGALLYSGLFSSAPKRRRPGAGALGLVKPSDKGELLGFGDSWFYNAFAPSNSSHFQEQLKALGWDTKTFKVEDYCRGAQRLADMAAIQPGTGIYALVEDLVADWKAGRGALPRAILLGGGGNDVKDGGTSCIWPSCDPQGTGSPLDGLVEGKGSTPPLNVDALNRFLNSMVDHLSVICRRLAASATSDGKQMIPIVVHGYDFPYPDGRPSALLLCPSLAPTFTRTGFRRPVGGNPMADGGAIAVMESLITELNRRYALAVDALHDNQGVDVRFKRLAGTLQSQADFNTNPAGYKKYWANELHPTTLGFKVLAAALSAELMNLPQPVGP